MAACPGSKAPSRNDVLSAGAPVQEGIETSGFVVEHARGSCAGPDEEGMATVVEP